MKYTRLLAILLLALAVAWSYGSLLPSYHPDQNAENTAFSTDRALAHVEQMGAKPHGVGYPAHAKVRTYIVNQLKELGLEVDLQEGYTAGDWGNLSRATNILARIPGSSPGGKALVLTSHYDSSPHSSYGASDAGSGVATILEGLRAYLAGEEKNKNDIIVLITDAEELGLNGAALFVQKHPWAKEAGLVLNFEARGSGGPSYMLIETNRGNAKLIAGFKEAGVQYPVANSLAYSIYKLLPNDTDLTVFREQGDIDGFNFAFIDDHFDYHTALDIPSRLDKPTLKHQGSYLMPLLQYYSQADLSMLKDFDDSIYFNVPVYKLLSYPYSFIWPLFALAVLGYVLVLILGIRKGKLSVKGMLKGIFPLLGILIVNGLVGYLSWPIIQYWYPEFDNMLHGFPYNGHSYIYGLAFFSLSVAFLCYNRFYAHNTADLIAAPLFLWLLITGLLSHFLAGASFFILPVFALLAAWVVAMDEENSNIFVLLFLALPAILICSPFIVMFPVGLGMKMLLACSLMVSLLFFFVLPILHRVQSMTRLSVICLFIAIVFGIKSHIDSDQSPERPLPSSLVYVQDEDQNNTYWATYDEVLGWNSAYFSDSKAEVSEAFSVISSKYGTSFKQLSPVNADQRIELSAPKMRIDLDTLIGEERVLELCISPTRNVNRLEIYTNNIPLNAAEVKGIPLKQYYLENRKGGRLVTHFISDNEDTELLLRWPKGRALELTLYESNTGLLSNKELGVPPRPEGEIPMPFVLNDALLWTKSYSFAP